MNLWLIDTGPLVAYLDAADPDHRRVSGVLGAFSGRLATTGAVITEAMHLLAVDTRGPRVLAELATKVGLEVYDLTTPTDLERAADLMERYTNLPMDFADSTLLLLADGLQSYELLTLDRRGFSAFRTPQGKAMRLVLDLV